MALTGCALAELKTVSMLGRPAVHLRGKDNVAKGFCPLNN